MTRKPLIVAAAGGSALLLAGAYVFQALGYLPCAMCLWQRWPHWAAIVIGIAALALPGRAMPLLGGVAAAVTSGIGVYHTGVERAWWPGPASCTGGGGGALSGDLLSMDGPRLILCDQVSWEFLTLSMASWNALFSAILVLIWIAAARAPAASPPLAGAAR
ncbi:Disulfide bond formation protein DsbB [Loktanella fryxellensis]|uniref:Disulfide bond formation protein DsbB n=1 Tax=Loktanella fryxellensis TaxID=245187 RepID=A0A1H7Y6Q6_9RHOB|nr:disulfide bond formation protein B [Loktanella fryxellensis]SEM41611.1 Disulfide bond formation protein DsbB [Loktanella fryxellensis]